MNTIPQTGRWNEISSILNDNFSIIGLQLLQMSDASVYNKGVHESLDALTVAYPTPMVGSFAYVGTTTPYTIYTYTANGWGDSGGQGVPTETNFSEITIATEEKPGLMSTNQVKTLKELGQTTAEIETAISSLQKADTTLTESVTKNASDISALQITIQDLDGDIFYICDAQGHVIAKIDKKGVDSIGLFVNGEPVNMGLNAFVDLYKDFYITDEQGHVIAKIDKDGISTTSLFAQTVDTNGLLKNMWANKTIATYGDSVTALNGGDFYLPYSSSATKSRWGGKVADYFGFAKIHNRGIGSTTFNYYNAHGGQIAWCKKATGEYVNRNDEYNYDNYEGNVTIPEDCTPIRGCGSSWLRITTMFPQSIKDDIDVVLVMYHNDFHQDMNTACTWVEGSSYDHEWAASSYYETYGGDYNIESVQGGIASVVMKFQAWMPNALIVLMTPISGVYINGNDEVKDLENTESAKMKKLSEVVKDIAFRMSIPCIDVYGTDGINTLNHKLNGYITDGIHPYSDSGCKKIARAVISGLHSIIPNIN